jgi:UDP-arabinose 4-epimerase
VTSPAILVTGGAGYIGSHVCKALSKQGYTPVVVDNLVNGHEWAVKWGPLVKGDIADRGLLDKTLQEYRPDAVVHLAAFAYVGESVDDPAKYYRNNFVGALTLLESMVANQVNKIVFSSSCATYGVPKTVPINEDQHLAPVNPYGRTKAMIEQMLGDFSSAYGIAYISLRYFNAAGADNDNEIGEAHDPETHLIPRCISAAYAKIPAVDIFGDDYATPDGTCIRDYIHVTDLAAAHYAALIKLQSGKASGVYNLGTGKGYSVKEVMAEISRQANAAIPFVMKKRRPGDPPALVADATRAMVKLSWKPEHSDLKNIIATALSWQQHAP